MAVYEVRKLPAGVRYSRRDDKCELGRLPLDVAPESTQRAFFGPGFPLGHLLAASAPSH